MDAVISPSPVRRSVVCRAPLEHAFEVFTAGMSRWWLKTHKIGKASLKDVVIEPRVGGRWFERGEDGSECDWGRVLAFEPPKRLLLTWQITADWQHDANFV